MINKKRLVRLCQDLIRIDSQNPGGNESKIAHFVKAYLSKFGVRAKIYEFKKNRCNVIAQLNAPGSKQSLLITPHLDTVSAGKGWRFGPFSAKIYRDKIYGLGATDCKGNLAVGIEVINSLIEDRVSLNYNLIFAATADEERGSGLGLIPLLDKGILRQDAAVVLDADEFRVIVAQKGLIHLKVKLTGKRAHGAYPWLGINAIDIAVNILHQLKNNKNIIFAESDNKYLKPPTINIGTIRGGDQVNVVSDWCEFELDLRFLTGDSPERILSRLREIIRGHTKKFKIEVSSIQRNFSIGTAHPLVENFITALKESDIKPKLSGSEGATTISFFHDKRIPVFATGFGCESCAHSVNEYVKIDNLYKGAQVLERYLRRAHNYGRDKVY